MADGPDISLPAATALIGGSQGHAETALELLVDAHLLQSAGPGRYRYHDLLRACARELAHTSHPRAEREEALRRMFLWYLGTAAAATALVHPVGIGMRCGDGGPGPIPVAFSDYADALAWMDAENANLVSAVRQAAAHGEHELAWKLAACLWALFYLRGPADDWITTHQIGLASARLLRDRDGERWMLNNLGVAYIHLKSPEAAIGCLRQCLPVARASGDVRAVATTLVNLGCALTDAGRDDDAMGPLQEALSGFREIANGTGEGVALSGIGKVCRRRGQFGTAIAYYHQALDASRRAGDIVTAGNTLLELSAARLAQSQIDLAIAKATEAADLYHWSGNHFGQAQAMSLLGRAERELGRLDRARQHWLGAAEIFARLGHPQAAEVDAHLRSLGSLAVTAPDATERPD